MIHAVQAGQTRGFSLKAGVSILSIVTGALLLILPRAGAAVLSLLLALVFISGGLYNTFAAVMEKLPDWKWTAISGVVSVGLGTILISQWPVTDFQFLGVFLGIAIIMNGWSLVMTGFASKKMKQGT